MHCSANHIAIGKSPILSKETRSSHIPLKIVARKPTYLYDNGA